MRLMRWWRCVAIWCHVIERLVDRARRRCCLVDDAATAARIAAVVAVGVVSCTGRSVAAGDNVSHAEATPRQA